MQVCLPAVATCPVVPGETSHVVEASASSSVPAEGRPRARSIRRHQSVKHHPHHKKHMPVLRHYHAAMLRLVP